MPASMGPRPHVTWCDDPPPQSHTHSPLLTHTYTITHTFTHTHTHTLQAPGNPEPRTMKVDLLVGCRPPQVSKVAFLCLNNSSIVYDGRVVVDTQFRSSDPTVYAAGSVAKLSRRYGRDVHFQHYNSREVGSALGEAVAASFTAPQGEGQPQQHLQLGRGGVARVVGCAVPGGLTFLFAGCPRAMAAPSLSPTEEGGRVLRTATELGFMQLTLDGHGCIHSIAYLGRASLGAHKFMCLVGLPVSYLNNLESRLAAGEVKCLVDFVCSEPWLDLLFHDQFASFRRTLLDSSLSAVAEGENAQASLVAAQEAVLEFVRSHALEFPMFRLPAQA